MLNSECLGFPKRNKKMGNKYTRTIIVLEEFAEHLFWMLTSRMTCDYQMSFTYLENHWVLQPFPFSFSVLPPSISSSSAPFFPVLHCAAEMKIQGASRSQSFKAHERPNAVGKHGFLKRDEAFLFCFVSFLMNSSWSLVHKIVSSLVHAWPVLLYSY